MTANSFVSVSLEPPLVLFSINKSAQLRKYIDIGNPVGISILSDRQVEVSRYYGGQLDIKPDIQFELRFNCPIISDHLAWYATKVRRFIDAGDHDLVLLEVLACHRKEGNPLIYYDGYKVLNNSESQI